MCMKLYINFNHKGIMIYVKHKIYQVKMLILVIIIYGQSGTKFFV